jgi:hypothetical protein
MSTGYPKFELLTKLQRTITAFTGLMAGALEPKVTVGFAVYVAAVLVTGTDGYVPGEMPSREANPVGTVIVGETAILPVVGFTMAPPEGTPGIVHPRVVR